MQLSAVSYQLSESPHPSALLRAGFSRNGRQKWGSCPFDILSRFVKRIVCAVLVILMVAVHGIAEETTFRRVRVPNLQGKQIKAVLTFSDQGKAIEVHPAKGGAVTIPYGQIDKCEYEYTNLVMGEKNHWLKIDYHDQDAPKVFVLL